MQKEIDFNLSVFFTERTVYLFWQFCTPIFMCVYLGNTHSKLCQCITVNIYPGHIYIVFSLKTEFKLSINRKPCVRFHMVFPPMTKGTVESFPEPLEERTFLSTTCSKPLLHKTALIRVT